MARTLPGQDANPLTNCWNATNSWFCCTPKKCGVCC